MKCGVVSGIFTSHTREW